MDTVKIEKGNVKMIAHRGVSGIEPENTNGAFIAAGNRSYFGIETDVHVTRDGKFIIMHDDSTLRTSGTEYIIEETDYETLRRLKLLSYDKAGERADLYMPDLVDYIRICKRYEKTAVLELKNKMEPEYIDGILAAIGEEDYLDHVVFISFSRENVLYLRKSLPKQPIQFLIQYWEDGLCDFVAENRFGLDIWRKSLTKERVEMLHARGVEVNCWTVNDPENAKELIEMGVDYITTNILE